METSLAKKLCIITLILAFVQTSSLPAISGRRELCTPGGNCGNGAKHCSEECDDGNSVDGDGCSSNCTIESGCTCTGANFETSVCQCCKDGIQDSNEECDDENEFSGDGCSSACLIEVGWECTGFPSTCHFSCGDSTSDSGEACDDGNPTDGDGCSSSCQIETGWECTDMPSNCHFSCGDGDIDPGETCDDDGQVDGDGCSSTCQIESDWECPTHNPSVCNLICSNSVIDMGETCDDGGLVDGDGCSSTCQVEADWECPISNPSVCNLICSNNNVDGGEGCDDGNLDTGDGCDQNCAVEVDWYCLGNPSVCAPLCGNGSLENAEECDDGNYTPNDGCTDCKIDRGYGCTSTPSVCTVTCGDGLIIKHETCDDANIMDEDGCDDVCSVERNWTCENEPSECIYGAVPDRFWEYIARIFWISFIISTTSQIILAHLFDTTLSSMWALVNTVQLIYYSAMITLYFPNVLLICFRYLAIANMQNEWMSWIYLLHFDETPLEVREAWDYRFLNLGVETTNVLLNCSDIFFALVLVLTYHAIVFIMTCAGNKPDEKTKAKARSCCSKLKYWISYKLYKDKEEFFFNTLFRLFYEAFLDVLFASVFNLYNVKWEEGNLDLYSNVVSIIWIVIYTVMLMVIPAYWYAKRSRFHSLYRLKMLMEDFKPEKRYLMMDHFVFMLRRIILMSVIVFGWNRCLMQISVFSIACIGVLIWKIVVRPFESTLLNFQEVIFEFSVCVIMGIYFSFIDIKTELIRSGRAHFAGTVCFIIVFFLTVLNFFISQYFFIKELRGRCKKNKSSKTSKIAPKSSQLKSKQHFRREQSQISDNSQAILRNQSNAVSMSKIGAKSIRDGGGNKDLSPKYRVSVSPKMSKFDKISKKSDDTGFTPQVAKKIDLKSNKTARIISRYENINKAKANYARGRFEDPMAQIEEGQQSPTFARHKKIYMR